MSSPRPQRAARVLVACDKFKGSLTAAQVAQHLATGLSRAAPGTDVVVIPLADGGDGTLDAACTAGFARVPITCAGPTGEPVGSAYAVRGADAVVEMADACGLQRLPAGQLRPMTSSSRGVGEVLAAVLARPEVRRVVLGIGGSASTDGGAGMLAALGARFCDVNGDDLPEGGAALAQLHTADLSGLPERLGEVELVLATDVASPLLGPAGAAAVFAPQKGASTAQVGELESAMTHFSRLISAATGHDDTGVPGAGAAGGVGYAALGVLGATVRPGVDVVLELSGFQALAGTVDLVITGEGSLDRQTLLGKAPLGVARGAHAAGKPVVAVCGRTELTATELAGTDIRRVYALTDLEPDESRCRRYAGQLLEHLMSAVAADWLSGP